MEEVAEQAEAAPTPSECSLSEPAEEAPAEAGLSEKTMKALAAVLDIPDVTTDILSKDNLTKYCKSVFDCQDEAAQLTQTALFKIATKLRNPSGEDFEKLKSEFYKAPKVVVEKLQLTVDDMGQTDISRFEAKLKAISPNGEGVTILAIRDYLRAKGYDVKQSGTKPKLLEFAKAAAEHEGVNASVSATFSAYCYAKPTKAAPKAQAAAAAPPVATKAPLLAELRCTATLKASKLPCTPPRKNGTLCGLHSKGAKAAAQ
jgi:hypothetical protein